MLKRIENWRWGIPGVESTWGLILYDGTRYVAKMKDGKWWMTQNLRYVPEGITVDGSYGKRHRRRLLPGGGQRGQLPPSSPRTWTLSPPAAICIRPKSPLA